MKISLAGECGVNPASPILCVLWTWSEMPAATTKKSYTLSLHVGALGARMTPPTFWSHPVAARSAGVQFQSPPRIHGPTSPESVNAMESKRSRLHLACIPPLPTMLNM